MTETGQVPKRKTQPVARVFPKFGEPGFKKPDLCVDIVCFFGDCIVLVKRNEEPLGMALPGGHVDFGERTEVAAIRELKEETGLDVDEDDIDLLCIQSDPTRDARWENGDGVHKISVCYVTVAAHGTPVAGSDADEVHLVPVHTINDIHLAFGDHDEIINKAIGHGGDDL